MEYPENTQSQPSTESTNQGDEVAAALKVYKADDNGKVIIPEGTPAYVATALKLEQQRRDSNSNYGKERSRADKAEARAAELEKMMANVASPSSLNAEQVAELEELKFTDPDAWFERKMALERANKEQVNSRVEEAVSQANKAADEQYTSRVAKSRDEAINEMLTTHNLSHPEMPITRDMLSMNIPPILMNKYQSGELDAPSFLEQVSKFVYSDRVVKKEDVLGQPSLGDASSSSAPTEKAETLSVEELYAGL